MKKIFFEDISKYEYFMSDKEIKDFTLTKIIFALIPLLLIIPMIMQNSFSLIIFVPVLVIIGYKFPYLYLSFRHKKNCNDVIMAIPLWLNDIYALIEKNTIHNAIVNSLSVNTPITIKKDLEEFIQKIEKNPEDKEAYLNFLARYEIDGFSDIMLKLFEFRSLDKTRLREEFDYLNDSLENMNKLKRDKRFKNEVSMLDYIVSIVIIGTPTIFLMMVAMMPELYNSFM